ncbi:mechanosensitive ion channel family protein [Streptomyces bohaiensis]|uniref:Mechanosensitive ion channel family protein n=1 Tax=Streptomyces bohaiensis TaxID=1431344 RepID=A0ABX1CHV8_9ACTN|nr:mechanosensitive ion channel family protein [Streptomyces bohaiensis]NJQ17405.1 mechanosensitive ion channel family protein [Streptomyces bohaiensis]
MLPSLSAPAVTSAPGAPAVTGVLGGAPGGPLPEAVPAAPRSAALADTAERATRTAGWLEANWESWLATGLRIVLIVVIAFVVQALVRRAVSRVIARMSRRERAAGPTRGLLVNPERRRQRSAAIGSVLRSVATLLILGTAALMVLDQLGIELGPLMASAGIVGVAIGFGARNLVTDVLTGMFMLLEDQYGVGDRIDAGEVVGEVLEIGLRVTTLRSDDGEIWYVRNGEIKRVGNLSQGWSTASVEVEVRASEDTARVVELVTRAGADLSDSPPWDELLWEPLDVLGLEAVSMDSQVIKATVKVPAGKGPAVTRELRLRIKKLLDAEGIPQVDPAGITLDKLRGDTGPGVPQDAARAPAGT